MRVQDPKMIEVLEYPPTEAQSVALLIVVVGVILTLLGLAAVTQTAPVAPVIGWGLVFFGACTSVLGVVLRNSD